MVRIAERLTACSAQCLALVHGMGTDQTQQLPDALGCERQTQLCLVCKRYLDPTLHAYRPHLIEPLNSGRDPRQDRRHMGY